MLMRLINRDQQGKKIYAAETSHRIANDETSGDLWFQKAGKLLKLTISMNSFLRNGMEYNALHIN